LILALVLITVLSGCLLSPLAFAVLHSTFKFANVYRRIFPFVLSETVWFALLILTSVNVTVGKDVRALTVLQAEFPFALISISILPLVHAVPIRFRLKPFTDVGVTEDAFPDALTLFQSLLPLAFVHFTIEPNVDTFAVRFVVFEFTLILVAVGITFNPSAIPIIIEPLALVQPA